jgi:hypothetical protein
MRWLFPLFIVAIAIALVIFDPDLSQTYENLFGPPPPATEEPDPQSTPEPEPTPQIAIDASSDRDPRDVLADMLESPTGPPPEMVYRYLPERFQLLDFREDWLEIVAPPSPTGFMPDPEAMNVEEYDGYVVVRSVTNWLNRWVFVEEDGEWRFDPGDRYLLMASAQIQQGFGSQFSYGMMLLEDYTARSRSEPDDGTVVPFVRARMEGVGVHAEGIDISLVWEHELVRTDDDGMIQSHLLSDVVVPLDQVTWEAGEQSGPVELTWTDGAREENHLRLPGWPSQEMADASASDQGIYAMPRYGSSIRLLGVPEDAEEILLRFNEVIVGPFGPDYPEFEGQTITYTWEFTFPPETTDPVMAGEPPEPGEEEQPDDTFIGAYLTGN